jgi:hypothetical protein
VHHFDFSDFPERAFHGLMNSTWTRVSGNPALIFLNHEIFVLQATQ